jgi:hypothetical protein
MEGRIVSGRFKVHFICYLLYTDNVESVGEHSEQWF